MSRQQPIAYSRALIYAVLIHGLLFTLMLIQPATPLKVNVTEESATPRIIKAVSIDERLVMAAVHQRRQAVLKQRVLAHKQRLAKQRSAMRLQTKVKRAKREANVAKRELARIQHKKAQAKTALQRVQQHAREAARQRQLHIAAEKRRHAKTALEALQLQQQRGEVDRFAALIKQAISRQWIVPSDVSKNSQCRWQIHLAPSGDVLDVRLLASSGNAALDRAAKLAIYKASPLPVPRAHQLYAHFKSFKLTMRPETVVAGL
jgi:colicin import membrane protein